MEIVFDGDRIEAIVTTTLDINEYNSVRFFVNGQEVLGRDLKMVVYIESEEEDDTKICLL